MHEGAPHASGQALLQCLTCPLETLHCAWAMQRPCVVAFLILLSTKLCKPDMSGCAQPWLAKSNEGLAALCRCV